MRKFIGRHKVLSVIALVLLVLVIAGTAFNHLNSTPSSSSSQSSQGSGSSNQYWQHGYSFVQQVNAGGGDVDGGYGAPGQTASEYCADMQLTLEPPEQGANVIQTYTAGPAHAGLPPPSSQDPNWENDSTAWVNGCIAAYNSYLGG